MKPTPNYQNIVDAANNKFPERIPLYEHNVSPIIIEKITGVEFAHLFEKDNDAFFKNYCRFFYENGYDVVTFENCITSVLVGGGALGRHIDPVIKTREDFLAYPFDGIFDLYVSRYEKVFDALKDNMPDGMRAIGGVGNGVFEIVQDLVGYENLMYLSVDDRETYEELFQKVGDVWVRIWEWFVEKYKDLYCVMRFGDDLGFRSNTLIPYTDIRECVIPQYKRIIDIVHRANRPFLLHCCGNIFAVMDDLIEAGIDAKHSNEDAICDYSEWIELYGKKIGNFGGIDTDNLVRMDEENIKAKVKYVMGLFKKEYGGFAIGSGNSIPDYVDPKKYMVMIQTVRELRGDFND